MMCNKRQRITFVLAVKVIAWNLLQEEFVLITI